MKRWLALLCLPCIAAAQHAHHEHAMLTPGGIVMNANHERLPNGCSELAGDVEFTVHAGRSYSGGRPGQLHGFDAPEFRVAPCSRVTVRLVNEDDVRHQWMLHGLPRYLYPGGMFHLEAMGGAAVEGTFIVPAEPQTYLVHCDMAGHMEKGMRAQLVVGAGSGNLWGIPGLSDAWRRDAYLPQSFVFWTIAASLVAALFTLILRRRA